MGWQGEPVNSRWGRGLVGLAETTPPPHPTPERLSCNPTQNVRQVVKTPTSLLKTLDRWSKNTTSRPRAPKRYVLHMKRAGGGRIYPVHGCDLRTETERGSGAGSAARSRSATPTANLPFHNTCPTSGSLGATFVPPFTPIFAKFADTP